jgi:hypothetical protein
MIKNKFLLWFAISICLIFIFVLPVALAQDGTLTKEEYTVITIAGLISPAVIMPATELLKQLLQKLKIKIDGISVVTSLGISFLVVLFVDRWIAKTHFTTSSLWFMTLNLQTFSQLIYEGKANLIKKKDV